MQLAFATVLEAAMLASAVSMDSFVSGFSYGSNKIKIPVLSVLIINIICSSALGISILLGNVVKQHVPYWLTIAICFVVLLMLGITKLLDSATKSLIRKYTHFNKEIKFSMFNIKFILNLYANPEDADVDASKIISPTEAASLAIALSLDGLAIGFGAAFGNINGLAVFLCSFGTGCIAVISGCYLGNKIARKLSFNLSWLSGILLIILAFSKLL